MQANGDQEGTTPSVREWLRGIEVFAGELARFDSEAAPEDPVELFLDWLREAIATGTPDPHSMTLSTVDEDGRPDARVLILKNVDAHGWQSRGSGTCSGRDQATVSTGLTSNCI